MPAWRNPLTPRAPGQSSASQAPSLAGPRWRRLCGSRSACLQEDATTSGGASASALYYTGAWSSRGGPESLSSSCLRRGWVILILHHCHGPAGRYYNGAVTRRGGPGASVARALDDEGVTRRGGPGASLASAHEGALRMPLEVVGAVTRGMTGLRSAVALWGDQPWHWGAQHANSGSKGSGRGCGP